MARCRGDLDQLFHRRYSRRSAIQLALAYDIARDLEELREQEKIDEHFIAARQAALLRLMSSAVYALRISLSASSTAQSIVKIYSGHQPWMADIPAYAEAGRKRRGTTA